MDGMNPQTQLSLALPDDTAAPKSRRGLRVLHTSDWHLGRALYGRRRDAEFEALMRWMVQTVQRESIDVVIVAGDVFDTTTPGVRAQTLYYEFLVQMHRSCCRHVVIVGGNHDSSLFLQAPAALLRPLGVHVVGHACEDLSDQVLLLRDHQGEPELIVCAVPYLRDRDVRGAVQGADLQAREEALVNGIRQHYATLADLTRSTLQGLSHPVPVVATGHLYAAGSQLREGEGVRDLYIGTLGQVHASVFDPIFDYVALGHLHISQRVGQQDRIRYSGAPLSMGFGEANQQKSVFVIQFEAQARNQHEGFDFEIQAVVVPVFQKLMQVRGDLPHILETLRTLQDDGTSCWVEVLYDSPEIVGDLREQINQRVADSCVDVLRIRLAPRFLEQGQTGVVEVDLQDLTPDEVFEQCLQAHQIPLTQQPILRESFQAVMTRMHQESKQEEAPLA